MRHQSAKPSGKSPITPVAIFVGALFVFIGFYLTKPSTIVGQLSAICFGILMTLGLLLLTVLDGRASSKGVRFFVDWIFGTILLGFVHLYMIGIDIQWPFMIGGSVIIAFVAMIAAIRTKFAPTAGSYSSDDNDEQEMRRSRH